MNTDTVQFEIREAMDELSRLLNEFKAGKVKSDNIEALRISLDHALEHICWPWNFRNISVEEAGLLPQHEFHRLGRTVPNFFGDRELLEEALS